ncbi:MAG: NAD(P)-dependent oxidoreductase [Betaproteobacteria bacterium]|nr:NAD(P)-dependent oxidoreductase [Betaproteobacteria bacterium]
MNPELPRKRVLLTGAGGFIGRHCLPILHDAGFEVHALSRDQRKSESGVQWHSVNLFVDGAAEKLLAKVRPTHLLHLAWYAEPGRYWTAPENFQWVRASLALLQAFAAQGGQRVVMAGTCAEYDWRHGWCSEEVTPLVPATVYGTCKHSLQAMLAAYSRQYELSSAWGRIFFLYGPHEHPSRLVSSVIRSLLHGEFALCSSGEQVRDFMHVADVASAFVTLLDSEVQGPINIASGEAVAIRDVVERISVKLGHTELLRLGARATPVEESPLLLADVRRLKNELGWQPSIGLNSGLDDTIAWWRTQPRTAIR